MDSLHKDLLTRIANLRTYITAVCFALVPKWTKMVTLRRRCGTTIVINICVFFIREFFIGLFLIWLFFKRLVLVWLFFIRLFLFVFGGCCLPGTHWMVCQLAHIPLHIIVPMLMTQMSSCKRGSSSVFTRTTAATTGIQGCTGCLL